MTELPILASAPFLDVVVAGTRVTAPYPDIYVYKAEGGPLALLRQQSGSTSRCWYVLDGRGNVLIRWR